MHAELKKLLSVSEHAGRLRGRQHLVCTLICIVAWLTERVVQPQLRRFVTCGGAGGAAAGETRAVAARLASWRAFTAWRTCALLLSSACRSGGALRSLSSICRSACSGEIV